MYISSSKINFFISNISKEELTKENLFEYVANIYKNSKLNDCYFEEEKFLENDFYLLPLEEKEEIITDFYKNINNKEYKYELFNLLINDLTNNYINELFNKNIENNIFQENILKNYLINNINNNSIETNFFYLLELNKNPTIRKLLDKKEIIKKIKLTSINKDLHIKYEKEFFDYLKYDFSYLSNNEKLKFINNVTKLLLNLINENNYDFFINFNKNLESIKNQNYFTDMFNDYFKNEKQINFNFLYSLYVDNNDIKILDFLNKKIIFNEEEDKNYLIKQFLLNTYKKIKDNEKEENDFIKLMNNYLLKEIDSIHLIITLIKNNLLNDSNISHVLIKLNSEDLFNLCSNEDNYLKKLYLNDNQAILFLKLLDDDIFTNKNIVNKLIIKNLKEVFNNQNCLSIIEKKELSNSLNNMSKNKNNLVDKQKKLLKL